MDKGIHAMMDESERYRLLVQWNATAAPYPHDRGAHDVFAEQAQVTPDAIAVEFEGDLLTYRQLDERANQLARHLRELGAGPETLVALCLPRSLELVVGLLGILKAGAGYLPVEPSYPGERIAFMLGDARALAVVTSAAVAAGELAGNLPENIALVRLDADWPLIAAQPVSAPRTGLRPDNLSYFIYTSGSTGKPKGVMNVHGALMNRLHWLQQAYGLTSADRVLQKTPFTFDVSVWEFLWPLMYGARLVVARPGGHKDPFYLVDLIRTSAITILHFVPSMLEVFLATPGVAACTSIRRVICSGEALPDTLQKRLFEKLDCELLNLYGPTEAAIEVTYWECRRSDDRGYVPIGQPIANVQVYVLDERLQPASIDVAGDLYLGGVGLARGYLDRAGLTAERFIANPFTPGERLYRTGDRARWRADGVVEYLGRLDGQIKLRGFRIELGEIDAVLRGHAGVREAVVVVRENGFGDKKLVAYVVPISHADEGSRQSAAVTPQQLQAHVQHTLPEFMVPAAIVLLDALPLNANGKTDRNALPEPDWSTQQKPYVAPRTPIEERLAQIWSEVLHLERVGIDDNFFELGGHSLQAIRLLSRLQSAFGVPLTLATLFAQPTLFAMAEVVSGSSAEALPAIERGTCEAPFALSFAQQRLWFLAQLEGIGAAYHISFETRLVGALDRVALRRSLDRVFARHEALRHVFGAHAGEPQAMVLPADRGFALVEHELSSSLDAEAQLERWRDEEAQAPLDLGRGPLVRGRLIRIGPEDHVLLLTQHHIVSDGWSIGVLTDEIGALYRSFAQGHDDPLPPLPIRYSDYAQWQRQWLSGDRLEKQRDYWRAQLADAPVLLELPTDRPRPSQQSFAGASIDVAIDAELTGALRRLSQQHGTTLFMTVLAAWAAVLSRLSGQHDLVVGTPAAGRNREELEPLIGFFVNTLALRIDLSDTPSVAQLLARVRATALAAQDHPDLPFEQVVDVAQPPRSIAHTPLFQVMLAWQNNDERAFELPGIRAEFLLARHRTAQFDLQLDLTETADGIAGSFIYTSALFDAATMMRHRDYLLTSLRAMVADSSQSISRIDLLSSGERDWLLHGLNRTESPYPSERCIHELFEDQVRRSPAAIAVVQGDAKLSYAQLNAQANRLARRLIAAGVRPDARVALCAERRIHLVVGLLGILKAGGAYVPLDPSYPRERLDELLADAEPILLLADAAGRRALGDAAASMNVVSLDEPFDAAEEGAENPDARALGLTSSHLAYLIYTSGSTGKPKGVMVEHAQTVNLLHWSGLAFADDEIARTLFSTSINFDLSVYECFYPLSQGATVHLVDDALALMRARHDVTLINTVPSAISAVLDAQAVPASIDTINLAGEPLKPALVKRLFANSAVRRVCNLYGPSETTTYSTWMQMDRNDPITESIGRPIANTRIYLLDAHRQPVPFGAVGELYIGGAGVTRGYLNRPELTAERFLADPFDGAPRARMYRTGDLARYLPDGNLAFLGRNDHQVKIRGFRIELGEIEARLARHPSVRDAVVIAREDTPGDPRLVAYVTANANAEIDVAQLRTNLVRQLPEYMVPNAFVALDALPLTSNGKLDRKALPKPDSESVAVQAYEAPQGTLEESLAAIWMRMLGVERVGRNDHFFALGGHSLSLVRLSFTLGDTFGVSLGVGRLYEAPVLQHMAHLVARAQSNAAAKKKTLVLNI